MSSRERRRRGRGRSSRFTCTASAPTWTRSPTTRAVTASSSSRTPRRRTGPRCAAAGPARSEPPRRSASTRRRTSVRSATRARSSRTTRGRRRRRARAAELRRAQWRRGRAARLEQPARPAPGGGAVGRADAGSTDGTSADASLASRYRTELSGRRRRPEEIPGAHHVFHLFVVRSPRRDALARELERRGVGTLVHYPRAVHEHPAYRELARPGRLDAERAALPRGAEPAALPRAHRRGGDGRRDRRPRGVRCLTAPSASAGTHGGGSRR